MCIQFCNTVFSMKYDRNPLSSTQPNRLTFKQKSVDKNCVFIINI